MASTTYSTNVLRPANLFWAAPAAGAVAALLNAGVYYAAQAAGAIPSTVFVRPNEPVTLVPVLISSFLPALVAGLVLFLLIKFTNRPVRIFYTVAVVLTLLSLASPFSIPGAPVSMALALNLMHVVAAVVITVLLVRWVKA